MLNLLNATRISDALFWMLVILGIFLIVEVAVFAILMIYKKHKAPAEKSRQAVSITLDTQVVRREFRVGEKFDPSGLIVTVHYNDEPYDVTLQDFTVITPELTKKLAREGKTPDDLLGCRIYAPDLSVEGKPSVVVAFQDQIAAYAITVGEPVASEVAPKTEAIVAPVIAEEPAEIVTFDITVIAPEELDALQVALYNGTKRVCEAVNVVDGKAAIDAPAGEYLVRVFGLPDSDYEVSGGLLSNDKPYTTVIIDYCEDYYTTDSHEEAKEPEVEEVVPTVSNVLEIEPETTLVDYNIVVNAPEGLTALQVALYNGDTKIGDAVNVESGAATITAEEGEYAVRVFGVPEGYEVSEGTVSATRYICTITITEIVKEAVEELAVTEATPVEVEQPAEPIIVTEESFEGGILRYDRSFTARLIQSDNEVKDWYTELKNDLLSYKKIHDRMSWKRESYNFGRLPFARLAYRGETLCLYLPLDPESLAESKYKVESVADSTSYEDTPCLYRIKNDRRVKYAKELIAMVAEMLQTPRIERESQDYYVPYEGLVELINKGLIKRNIKNKKDEIFFEKKTETDN